jgi:hypothetical protein
MKRRRFMLGAATIAVIKVFPMLADDGCLEKKDTESTIKEEDFDTYEAFLKERYPTPPNLTMITDFSPKPIFIDQRLLFVPVHRWNEHPGGIARVNRALSLISSIWTSRQFKERVEAAPDLIWRYDPDHPNAPDRTITGVDLYKRLLSERSPKFTIQLVTDTHSASSEAARSGGTSIKLQNNYASTNASVYQLVNTISHEYTHLDYAGASLDRGRTGDDLSLYVSYGIGGLTENMAAGKKLYCSEIPRRQGV